MNIVLIHTDFRIYWPARIRHLFNFLKSKNISLRVIELADSGGNYDFDREVIQADFWEVLFTNIPLEQLDPGLAYNSSLKRLIALKPDLVIAGPLAFPSGAAAVEYSNRYKTPLIMFDDARLQDVPRNFLINWVKRQLYSSVDAIFCPAPAWDETFHFFGFKKEEIFYGVDVVDNSFFYSKSKVDSFDQLPVEGYFLTIGRQVPKKNLIMLLQAYYRLSLDHKNIPHLVLVGEGESRQELEAFVSEKGLKTVHFLPFQPQEVIRDIYRKASLFIFPSLFSETWGLVVNEAMASGLPVLVSKKAGCASTLIKDRENGLLFDPENELELLNKLEQFLLLSSDQKNGMGKHSLDIIQSWDLDRFSLGLFEAINYVKNHPKLKSNWKSGFISRLWKGRYRPV